MEKDLDLSLLIPVKNVPERFLQDIIKMEVSV